MRNIRKDYEKGKPIVIKEENKPLELLEIWINDALENGVTEPNAMNIATVDSNGYPRNRMVLIKYLENEQIGFFTNLKSDKSIELQGNSRISCTIWWPEMERQVRVEGVTHKMKKDFVEDYFSSRPRKSRIAAWASDQSKKLESRKKLEDRFDYYNSKFEGGGVPLPPFWGGYIITPERVEYWEGRPSRLHERVVIKKSDNRWITERLYP